MNWKEQALERLNRESTVGRYNKYAVIMKDAVHDLLVDFCRQNEEFAQAVVQGGTFEDCMKTVAIDCGNGVPDAEIYRRAVQFYFPGAEVIARYELDLTGNAKDSPAMLLKTLNLADFW